MNYKTITKSLIIALISLLSFGTKAQKAADNLVLFKLGNTPYTVEEFRYHFLKNSERPTADSAKIKIEEYLDLYTKFRLKVHAAIDLKMDQDPAFINEFQGYKEQLIEPYLIASQMTNEQVQEAYDRMQWEVSASHLLVRVTPESLPEDTLKAWNLILEYKKQILDGADFGEVAKNFSQDPSAAQNKGHLGYFSAMQMVYEFENAAYNNEIGEVVGPFRTQFGYHLLQVHDKRMARGQLLVAHIMLRFDAKDSTSIEKSKAKAMSVYTNVTNGKDWNEQCQLYSEDKNTSSNGGQLRWFGTGGLVGSFEDAAFKLTDIGSISEPIMTNWGWHIIKLLDRKELPTLKEQRAEIEQKISRDSRSNIKKSTALKRLKSTYGYKLDSAGLKIAFEALDSSLLIGQWKLDSVKALKSKGTVLFSLSGKKETAGNYWEFVKTNQRNRPNIEVSDFAKELYNSFEEKSIFDYERTQIEKNNKEFKLVLDEYKSGILLFNLMEEKVWDKAVRDTTGQKQYYETHLSKYPLTERLLVKSFISSDSSVINKVKTMLTLSDNELDSIFNGFEPLTLQISEKEVAQGELPFLDAHWQVGNYVEATENYKTLWVVKEVKEASVKPFEEIKGLVISDYQNELERLWIDELKVKYPVKINNGTIKKLVKEFE